MLLRLPRAVAILGLLPAIAAANSGIIQVTGLRSWSNAVSTRVIIETTGPFEFQADRAVNPDRLFFDIRHARPYFNGRRYATREVGDHLVRRIRIAETVPGTTRVVFDLESAAEFTVSKMDTPDRLVVEIRPGRTFSSPTLVSAARRRVFIPPPPPAVQRPALYEAPVLLASYEPPLFYLPDPFRTLTINPPRRVRSVSTRVTPSTRAATRPAILNPPPRPSESATRSLTRALGLKINRIVIDAGHGGHDQGTIGPNGILEKDVVLDVALRVAKLIEQRMGAEVVLTRSDDTFIPLHERTMIANQHRADLFLSIHANSSPIPSVAGTETFFLNFSNSPSVLDVAARENAGSGSNVGELRDLIQSITLNDKIEESRTFAQTVQETLQGQAEKSNPAARNRGVKRAPFVVLIGASMPSILAEIGFLSNAKDEHNLGKADYREKVAEALYKGVAKYSQSLSHFDVAQKSDKITTLGLNQ